MKKTDGRHYNRQEDRDLALEMDLWSFWVGKLVQSSQYTGIVTDLELQRITTKLRRVEIEFDSNNRERFLLNRRAIVGLKII